MEKEILSINNLNKEYLNNGITQQVLRNVNVCFFGNQIIGLLGRNGAGKTTFIKSCIDLIKYEGNISYLGKPLEKMTGTEKVNTFSAVLEGSRNVYWKLSVIENIKYFSGLRGINFYHIKETVCHLLNILFLYEKRNQLVETFSTGMKQKVALICAFAMNTPIIFLDEPTLGLDLESKNHVIDLLIKDEFRNNKLIIVTSHDLDLINRVSSDIVLLKDGQISKFSKNESVEKAFDFTLYKNAKLDALVKPLNLCEIYQNDRSIKYRIVCNSENLSVLVSNFEKNGIEINRIENSQHNIENFFLS